MAQTWLDAIEYLKIQGAIHKNIGNPVWAECLMKYAEAMESSYIFHRDVLDGLTPENATVRVHKFFGNV